jgi:hypothetical protein
LAPKGLATRISANRSTQEPRVLQELLPAQLPQAVARWPRTRASPFATSITITDCSIYTSSIHLFYQAASQGVQQEVYLMHASGVRCA